TLEESIPEIVGFIRRGGSKAFPFMFIDPTGWTGFEMETIAPLLRLNPGEVLIKFMTGHIRRFLDSPDDETQDSFKPRFGSGGFRAKIQGLARLKREDAAVEEYTTGLVQKLWILQHRARGRLSYGENFMQRDAARDGIADSFLRHVITSGRLRPWTRRL